MTGAAIAWSLAVVGLLAYEAYAIATKRELLTTVVRRVSYKTLLLPFLAGMLCGHFFFCGCQ